MNIIYKHKRPNLAIEHIKSYNIGRCLNSDEYEVTSLRPLTIENIRALRDAGFLGGGQMFSISFKRPDGMFVTRVSGNEEPTGHDVIEAMFVDRDNKVIGPADRPSHNGGYYKYSCTATTDSGD